MRFEADSVELEGPAGNPGSRVVLFAHGSGSSHWSPRNTNVAAMLLKSGIGTFLFDLLTEHGAQYCGNVFDVELLARCRLAARLLRKQPANIDLSLGYFGASTGAAPALIAAARDQRIDAVVSSVPAVVALTLHCVGKQPEKGTRGGDSQCPTQA
jgi:putative phosphoribosyl transferase